MSDPVESESESGELEDGLHRGFLSVAPFTTLLIGQGEGNLEEKNRSPGETLPGDRSERGLMP